MTGGMFLFRLTLIAALPSFAKDHQVFSTKVFTSPDDQFWVNSTIIEGAPLDASTAVDFTERYLVVFEEELKRAENPEGLVESMKARFPSADLILSVERGAKANVKH